MATSEFLAKLIGPLFVAVGTGMLVNRGTYQSVIAEGLRSALLLYLSGVMSLLSGLAIVLTHNVWSTDWRVIITVLGWLMVIGGIVRIVLPQFALTLGAAIYSGSISIIIVAIGAIAFGAFLSFHGYYPTTRTRMGARP
jgi:hypothetical protein